MDDETQGRRGTVDDERAVRLLLAHIQGDEAAYLLVLEEAFADPDAGGARAGRLLQLLRSLAANTAQVHVAMTGSEEASIAGLQRFLLEQAAGDTQSPE